MSIVGWYVAIALWLALGWTAFAFYEARGLKHQEGRTTLSMALYTVGSKFPLSILAAGLLIGLFVGGLGVHVLWHWCPEGSTNTGSLDLLLTSN